MSALANPARELERRLQAMVGHVYGPVYAWDEVNRPMIRHWCAATGNVNPAYLDPASPAALRHGGLVAPPTMLQVWMMPGPGGQAAPGSVAEGPETLLALLAEHGYTASVGVNSEQEYRRHVRLGERLHCITSVAAISPRKVTAVGAGYFVTLLLEFRSEEGEAVGTMHFRQLVYRPEEAVETHAGPAGGAAAPQSGTPGSATGAAAQQPAAATATSGMTQQRAADAAAATPCTTQRHASSTVITTPDSAVPHPAHDAGAASLAPGPDGTQGLGLPGMPRAGDALPALSIPVTLTSIVAGAIATRDFHPVHHDVEAARQLGMPTIFMNILTTNACIERHVYAWAGERAVLEAVSFKLGTPNFAGDVMTLSGSVLAADAQGRIELAVRGVNSRGAHVDARVRLRLA